MNTLVLDTSSKYLYFSFLDNGKVIHSEFSEGKNDHSDKLLKNIGEALNKLNLKLKDFSRIIVGIGPGSYTGLRVSVTVGKTLAWTLKIPLYIVSSLDLLASGHFGEDGVYAITIRAKRNHSYFKLLEVKENKIKVIIDDIFINDSEFSEKVGNYKYKLVNEDNYKIDVDKLQLKKVSDIHSITPNYIQRSV